MTENNDIEHCNQRSWIYNTRTQVSVLVSEKKLICNFVLTSDNSPCLIYNNMHVWISKKNKNKSRCIVGNPRQVSYTLKDGLPTYWIYLVFMNISYSLFTNEIAKLFDSEFENEDHAINMPFLKDACVSIKIYGTDEMFFTIDNDVKEPCNLNRAWIIQENKKKSANWPTIIKFILVYARPSAGFRWCWKRYRRKLHEK